MHGMGGQILPRGYLGITPPDVECIHGLGGMDSTMEHACATLRAEKKPDESEIQVLNFISLSIGQMAWPFELYYRYLNCIDMRLWVFLIV